MESKQGFDFGSIEQALRTKEQEKLSSMVIIAENPTRMIR